MNSIGVAVSWLLGCALGLLTLGRHPQGLGTEYAFWIFACALLLGLPAFLLRSDYRARWSLFLLIALLLGCASALLRHPPVTEHTLAFYNEPEGGPRILVTGIVSAEPVLTDRSQKLRVQVYEVRPARSGASVEVNGDLLAIVPRYPVYDIGERVLLTGTLTAPPNLNSFDYAGYLARQGVYSYLAFPGVKSLGPGPASPIASLLAPARASSRSVLKSAIPEPEASLAVGVVTGDRTTMPRALQEAFAQSGTVHILAISGENIALIVGFLWLLYARLDMGRMPLWLTIFAILLVCSYTLFTGAAPSVVRAAIMSAVLLVAPLVGRRYDPVAALAVSACVMTLFDPNLLFDPGFDLSFGAMLGIGLVSPSLSELFSKLRCPRFLAVALAAGIGAQAFTLPLTVLLTGRASPVSPLATLTVDPALLPLMLFGIAAVLFSPWVPALAVVFGWLSWVMAGWMIWWVQFWSSVPFSSVDLSWVGPGFVWAYYGLLLGWLFTRQWRSRWRPGMFLTRRRVLVWSGGIGLLSLWGLFLWLLIER